MKANGADVVALIADASAPAGSVNLSGRGVHIDARA